MPRPCMYEFTCSGCGDSYVAQGTVADSDEYPRRCMTCAMDGKVYYYTMRRL